MSRSKKSRFVGFVPGSWSPAGFGLLQLRLAGVAEVYFLRVERFPLGWAFELSPLHRRDLAYTVAVPLEGPPLCDHPLAAGFGRRCCTDCKHCAALAALVAAGRFASLAVPAA